MSLCREYTRLSDLSSHLLKNYHWQYASLTGNILAWHNPTFCQRQFFTTRKHTWVHNMSAKSLSTLETKYGNTVGFSGSMTTFTQYNHGTTSQRVWDFFETIPFFIA